MLISLIFSLTAFATPFIQIAGLEDKPSTDCRAHIREIMCVVKWEGWPPKARPCLPGGEKYAHFFEELHDRYPPALQKMFCSLDRIHIEQNFDGTAYASEDPVTGAIAMGIRQSVLDEGLDLQRWSSWKEQLNFGGATDSYTVADHLPAIRTSTTEGVNDFLYFVIAHEFGHFLDFANDLNETECGAGFKGNCAVTSGSWGSFSWINPGKPLPENDFAGRTGLCFYWCGDRPLPMLSVLPVYAGLDRSNFISTYAATNPGDDFADSLGYYMVDKYLRQSYWLDTRQGANYDIMAKLHSERFAPKYRYIEEVLARPDLKYP